MNANVASDASVLIGMYDSPFAAKRFAGVLANDGLAPLRSEKALQSVGCR